MAGSWLPLDVAYFLLIGVRPRLSYRNPWTSHNDEFVGSEVNASSTRALRDVGLSAGSAAGPHKAQARRPGVTSAAPKCSATPSWGARGVQEAARVTGVEGGATVWVGGRPAMDEVQPQLPQAGGQPVARRTQSLCGQVRSSWICCRSAGRWPMPQTRWRSGAEESGPQRASGPRVRKPRQADAPSSTTPTRIPRKDQATQRRLYAVAASPKTQVPQSRLTARLPPVPRP